MEVKIIYNGPVVEIDRMGMEIARYFSPDNSYVDSPVYMQGYPIDAEEADKKYGKSIYATNVDGWGALPGLLPMANTTVKFAQFERAAMAKAEADMNDAENEGITFEIEGYEEEIYWNQMGANMAPLGFYTKVGDKEYGDNPQGE